MILFKQKNGLCVFVCVRARACVRERERICVGGEGVPGAYVSVCLPVCVRERETKSNATKGLSMVGRVHIFFNTS